MILIDIFEREMVFTGLYNKAHSRSPFVGSIMIVDENNTRVCYCGICFAFLFSGFIFMAPQEIVQPVGLDSRIQRITHASSLLDLMCPTLAACLPICIASPVCHH